MCANFLKQDCYPTYFQENIHLQSDIFSSTSSTSLFCSLSTGIATLPLCRF
ncbi:hypothetical protein FORC36_0733 [Vibrio vulnificus]|nr:hypothetical protein FORC36_0733 [Vibrio vulnificus]